VPIDVPGFTLLYQAVRPFKPLAPAEEMSFRMKLQRFQIDRVHGHTVLKNFLNRTGKVIDLGMNNGDFARIMDGRYGCLVIGVEANPVLATEISRLNGVVCKNAAISALDGFVKFSIDEENPEASGIVPDSTPLSKTVIVVPSMSLSTLVREAEAEQIDLLKIDVEGAELDVIETTDPEIFQRCTQIAIEFHSFIYPSHAERIEKAIALLSELGFHCTDFSTNRSDVLFINRHMIYISAGVKALLVLQKYHALIVRRVRRIALT